jgi:hypothetical protein
MRAIKKMQEFKTNKDILKIIEKRREEEAEKAKEEREKKIKDILKNK